MSEPNVPQRFADASIKAWGGERAVIDVLESYVECAAQHFDSGRGLLIIGPPGVGKTFLACAVLNALHPKYSVRFVTLYTYLRSGLRRMELKDQWLHQDDDDAYRTWKLITRELEKIRNDYDFVVLDDVGMEHHTSTAWSEDEFQIVVRARFDLALPTILTSNHALDEWSTVYGDAMRSFVKEAFVIVSITGDDLR